MADVLVKLYELEYVAKSLGDITQEFDDATSRSEALEEAIGSPFGRSDLKDKAQDFEERWDDKRTQLNESLKDLVKYVTNVVEAFKGWDSETAIAFENTVKSRK